MKYSDIQRIKKILDYATQLIRFLEETELSRETLIKDYKMQWAVTTPLFNIGEQVYNLSKEYKVEHDEVDWHLISGLRHRLVHDYDDTSWEIIANIVFDDIPILVEQLNKLVVVEEDE